MRKKSKNLIGNVKPPSFCGILLLLLFFFFVVGAGQAMWYEYGAHSVLFSAAQLKWKVLQCSFSVLF